MLIYPGSTALIFSDAPFFGSAIKYSGLRKHRAMSIDCRDSIILDNSATLKYEIFTGIL